MIVFASFRPVSFQYLIIWDRLKQTLSTFCTDVQKHTKIEKIPSKFGPNVKLPTRLSTNPNQVVLSSTWMLCFLIILFFTKSAQISRDCMSSGTTFFMLFQVSSSSLLCVMCHTYSGAFGGIHKTYQTKASHFIIVFPFSEECKRFYKVGNLRATKIQILKQKRRSRMFVRFLFCIFWVCLQRKHKLVSF